MELPSLTSGKEEDAISPSWVTLKVDLVDVGHHALVV